jgi:hypothetical protein
VKQIPGSCFTKYIMINAWLTKSSKSVGVTDHAPLLSEERNELQRPENDPLYSKQHLYTVRHSNMGGSPLFANRHTTDTCPVQAKGLGQ